MNGNHIVPFSVNGFRYLSKEASITYTRIYFNNGPLIGEYIWSKSDGDITVRKFREQ